ncbi:MAG: class I SAM-dependent methyltransferase, partial [Gemmatimonadaceae bacterium]
VQSFYDQIGWQEEEGVFTDTRLFEDLRAVSRSYVHKCHLRVQRHLPARGKYLLDAASGPVHFPEYREYSREFEARICVDLSFAALRAARRNLGDRGIYLLADITNLPLADGTVDAAISLHTIYHVARDAQAKAFGELRRVIRPGSSAVVVYTWPARKSLARRTLEAPVRGAAFLANLPRRVVRRVRRLVTGTAPPPPDDAPVGPNLYFHAFTYAELRRMLAHTGADFLVWRSVSLDFLKRFAHERFLGGPLLALIYQAEELFPRLCGRIGQYPLIILRT